METYFITITKETLLISLMVTLPPVCAAMAVGLVVSLIQATTQINEMTLTFVPKLVVVILTLAIVGPWALMQLVSFANSLLTGFPNQVR